MESIGYGKCATCGRPTFGPGDGNAEICERDPWWRPRAFDAVAWKGTADRVVAIDYEKDVVLLARAGLVSGAEIAAEAAEFIRQCESGEIPVVSTMPCCNGIARLE